MNNSELTHTVKVNIPGGIIAAGDLLTILNAAEKSEVSHISIGNRQQLYITVESSRLEDLEHEFSIADIKYEIGTDVYPNILSSYVSEDIFSTSNWLREGVYKDILDLFEQAPKIKINLVDNNQTFIPFFTGNLNFIASETSNYWHLHIRFPKTSVFYIWPDLVYTEDIPSLSLRIEEVILREHSKFYDLPEIDGNLLYLELVPEQQLSAKNDEKLLLPDFQLPYYEGFNRYGTKDWLGIYKRSEQYSVSFLKDVCAVCLESRIGQLNTTPWKSLIIKGIEQEERKKWTWVLAKHRVNVRHASNELNWQTEDACAEALLLKHHLVREFDKDDIRTFKLCFAIKINPKSGLFGSVIIRRHTAEVDNSIQRFDIYHTRDYNPNSKDYVTYAKNISYINLADELKKLCDNYYELQTSGYFTPSPVQEHSTTPDQYKTVQQCTNCLTIYDPDYGDSLQNVAAGTLFEDLPDTYRCQMCDADKDKLIPLNFGLVQ